MPPRLVCCCVPRMNRRKVSAMSGSNCVSGVSLDLVEGMFDGLRPAGRGRSLVIASNESTTEKMRAAIGISSPRRPDG